MAMKGVTTDNVVVNTSVVAASMRRGTGDRSSSLPKWGRAGAVVLLAGRGCCKPVAVSLAWLQARITGSLDPLCNGDWSPSSELLESTEESS
jgi:hypothetical protein